MTESENENDHFDLDHFDHFFKKHRLNKSLIPYGNERIYYPNFKVVEFDHFRMRQVAMEREKSNKKFACLLT